MRRPQHLPNRLHQRIPHDDRQITPRVAFRLIRQSSVLGLSERARGCADVEVEHLGTGGGVGEGDVDAFFESVGRGR
jgi:hypothetical protein